MPWKIHLWKRTTLFQLILETSLSDGRHVASRALDEPLDLPSEMSNGTDQGLPETHAPALSDWPTKAEDGTDMSGRGLVRTYYLERLFEGADGARSTVLDLPIGAAFLDPGHEYPDNGLPLSIEYREQHRDKRSPIVINMPQANGSTYLFSPDWAYMSAGEVRDGRGWTVTGEPPEITVNPSVNIVGSYHGWIQDGVISDDLYGRVTAP